MKRKNRVLRGLVGLTIAGVLATSGVFFYLGYVVDRSGWIENGGRYQYLDSRGNPVAGWVEDGGSRYYFDSDSWMVTGWQEIEGRKCWFSPAGVYTTGWIETDEGTFYLTEDGAMASGWQNVEGQRRYFLPGGQLATGWQEVDGSRCYLTQEGTIATGWLHTDEGSYYLSALGYPYGGLAQIDGRTYYFYQGSGLMHQGWLDLGESRYYFDADGAMVTGWQEVDGRRCFFNEDGTMHTGWLQQGEYRYYLLEDGSAATEPREIDGVTQFFTPEGVNLLLVNYRYGMPENYKVDLVRYGEWARVAAITEQKLRQMILDCRATGIECWLNCGFRTFDEQTEILETRTAEYEKNGMDYDTARAKALETVAVPGYSEHQTGLAMDIVCSGDPEWLHEHCWEYGFILRYPEGKSDITNISYEHWHYRYVGVEVAMAMKDTGLCLEEYLGAA